MLRPLAGCLIAESPADVQAALEAFHGEYEAGAAAWVDRGNLIDELQYRSRVERFAELIHEVARARSPLA
jgi:hypothetical protein